MASAVFALPREVATTVTVSATLAKGKHTPANATSGNLTLTLPTGASQGVPISVEKIDNTANTVTLSGSIRGSASTIILANQFASVLLVADASGSWWVVASSLGSTAAATTTASGIVELATNAETTTGSDTVRATTPAGVAAALAAFAQPVDTDLTNIAALTTTSYGRTFLTLANQAALTALLPAASATASGIVELATDAEATTGIDTVRATTPANVTAVVNAKTLRLANTPQTVAGVVTFSQAPVVPDDSFTTAKVANLDEAIAGLATDADVALKYTKPPTGGKVIVRQSSTAIGDARITSDTTGTAVWWFTTYSGQPTNFAAGDIQDIA